MANLSTTDRIALECPLLKWSGDPDSCRVCDRQITGRNRVFHSKRCARSFAQNHFYRKARAACRVRYRLPCKCDNVKRHVVCHDCGRCEGEITRLGGRMEVHHLNPRRGDRSTVTCLHHQDNLISVDNWCHQIRTNEQKLLDYHAKQEPDNSE